MAEHQAVMKRLAADFALENQGASHLDCTIDNAHYFLEYLSRVNYRLNLYGIDLDPEGLKRAARNLQGKNCNVTLKCANFSELGTIATEWGVKELDSIIFDLGLSSEQIDDSSLGFSYAQNGPLRMTFDPSQEYTAAEVINSATLDELTRIIYQSSGERKARQIAAEICRRRPLTTTGELAEVVRKVCPGKFVTKSLARVFMAFRSHVNEEHRAIELALPAALNLLKPGGRIIAISYDSEEDRRIKDFFRMESAVCRCEPGLPICVCGAKPRLKVLTKKVITPEAEEIAVNSRATAARMRVAERI